MAVTAALIKELRERTGVGMSACKNALVETDGNMDAAIEFLRKQGLANAAKKAGRIAAEGLSYAYISEDNSVAVAVEVNSETDFVAKNEKFQNFVKEVAQHVVTNDCANVDEFLASPWGGEFATVQDALNDMISVIGEKLSIRRFEKYTNDGNTFYVSYIHAGGKIAVIVEFATDSKDAALVECGKNVAMQIAAMNPIAIDEDGVSEEVKQKEIEVAIEKTKAEQVQKAVEAALKKANINPAHVDSEEHMESNMAKGWITAEDVAKAKEIIATVSAEKAAHLPEQMIQNIAKGRLGKFLKEVCLLNQEDIMDAKKTVREVLAAADPELKIVDFKRFTLKAE